jgi:hypothetical protein
VVYAVNNDQPKLRRGRLRYSNVPPVDRLLRVTFLQDTVRVDVGVDALGFSVELIKVFLRALKPESQEGNWIRVWRHALESDHPDAR